MIQDVTSTLRLGPVASERLIVTERKQLGPDRALSQQEANEFLSDALLPVARQCLGAFSAFLLPNSIHWTNFPCGRSSVIKVYKKAYRSTKAE